SILVASADLDEELIYKLTKALWEGQEELAGMLAALKDLDIEKAFDGITVDYHPGAIKYYKEIGKM
ncbi:MAG: TAXI family TRAP transporter solute-binding subunit, partial [Oscillospiraceae bacterium]